MTWFATTKLEGDALFDDCALLGREFDVPEEFLDEELSGETLGEVLTTVENFVFPVTVADPFFTLAAFGFNNSVKFVKKELIMEPKDSDRDSFRLSDCVGDIFGCPFVEDKLAGVFSPATDKFPETSSSEFLLNEESLLDSTTGFRTGVIDRMVVSLLEPNKKSKIDFSASSGAVSVSSV